MALVLAPASQVYAQLVTGVVDGDTLIVQGVGRVRLIGVDTPETVDPRRPVQYFGKEASVFTHRMAEGKVVRLEFDAERKDRFGRTLAYVYLPDGTFLNAELVKQGYGHAYTQFPFRYLNLNQFRNYEREARDAGNGLWGDENALVVLSETQQDGESESAACVDINRADSEELQQIIHVGPARARQILALRRERPFRSVNDLTRANGIATGRLRDIIAQGVACVNEAP